MEILIAYLTSGAPGPAGIMVITSCLSISNSFCIEGGTYQIGHFSFAIILNLPCGVYPLRLGFRCAHAESHVKRPNKLTVPEVIQCPNQNSADDATVDHGRHDLSRIDSQLLADRKPLFVSISLSLAIFCQLTPVRAPISSSVSLFSVQSRSSPTITPASEREGSRRTNKKRGMSC